MLMHSEMGTFEDTAAIIDNSHNTGVVSKAEVQLRFDEEEMELNLAVSQPTTVQDEPSHFPNDDAFSSTSHEEMS